MNAGAKESLLASVVNNDGVIEARSVVERNGEIILLAGMAAGSTFVNGILDASASTDVAEGGFIETSGHKVKVADSAQITTASDKGNGQWLIDPNDFTIAASGGDISGAQVSSSLANNNFTIFSAAGANSAGEEHGTIAGNGDIFVNDNITWNTTNTLTLNAERNIEINQSITATASGKLHFLYGQGAVASGNTASYSIDTGNNAQVNLQAGLNFSTILGSDGIQVNHTVINELSDLQGMSGNLAGSYALGANIDATATAGWNGVKGFKPIGNSSTKFTGTLDGLGHSIDKLLVNRSGENYIGLIGYSSIGSSVSNLGLTSVAVVGGDDVGGIIGQAEGDVSNIYVTGSVDGNNRVGGLIGRSDGIISTSYTAVSVSGDRNTGGLAGQSFADVNNSYATGSVNATGDTVGGLIGYSPGTVSNSYATGAVAAVNNSVGGLIGNLGNKLSNSYATGSVNGGNNTGGLVGYFSSVATVSVSNSYATGAVISTGFNAGGLVGFQRAGVSVSNSYATGSVDGDIRAGGLIGLSQGDVSNSYATGHITGTGDVGGLIAFATSTISNSYWDKDTSGQLSSAGSLDSFGKTSAEMQQLATFGGWDIDNVGSTNKIWRIYGGNTAPLLRSFLTPKDLGSISTTAIYNGSVHTLALPSQIVSLGSIQYTNAGSYAIGVDRLFSDQQGYDLPGRQVLTSMLRRLV